MASDAAGKKRQVSRSNSVMPSFVPCRRAFFLPWTQFAPLFLRLFLFHVCDLRAADHFCTATFCCLCLLQSKNFSQFLYYFSCPFPFFLEGCLSTL